MKQIFSESRLCVRTTLGTGDNWDMVLAFEGLQSMNTEMGTRVNMEQTMSLMEDRKIREV